MNTEEELIEQITRWKRLDAERQEMEILYRDLCQKICGDEPSNMHIVFGHMDSLILNTLSSLRVSLAKVRGE